MKYSLTFRSAVASLALALLFSTAGAAHGQAVPSLFVEPARAQDARIAQQAGVARARRVALRTDLLAAALVATPSPRAPFLLNLFDDVVLTIDRERLERDTRGHVSWVGAVAGDATSTASLTWNGGTLVGGVVTRGVAYDLATADDGAVVVREHLPMIGARELPPRVPSAGHTPLAPRDPLLTAHAAVIDVLVAYTAAARVQAGGAAQMAAAIANALAVTNTAFQRSGVDAVVREAGIIEGSYTEATTPFDPILSDLYAISPGGTASAAVEALRSATGADLVALITGRTASSICGVAWLGPAPVAAYSVTEQVCLAAGQWSFSHELGHNFGANHAPGDGGAPPPAVPYAQAYRDGPVRTLMAYADPGLYYPRILNFSSGTVREPMPGGAPTGNSLQNNARRLNETAATVAGYRTAPHPVPPAPEAFAASVSGTTVTLSWTPPSAGGTVSAFEVEGGPTPGSAAYGRVTLTQSPATVADVPLGTHYLRLRSVGPTGTSAPSSEIAAVVSTTCAAPGRPSLSVTVSAGVVAITWSAPAGSSAPSYYLGVGSAPGSDDLGVFFMGAATSVSATPPAGTYYLRVVAASACGVGPGSIVVAVTVS